jgi:hypothetical protein
VRSRRPNPVALEPPAPEVAHRAVLVNGAGAAQVRQQPGDGVLGEAGHADGRPDAVALNQRLLHELERAGIATLKCVVSRRRQPAIALYLAAP